jgi:hypothetical protein
MPFFLSSIQQTHPMRLITFLLLFFVQVFSLSAQNYLNQTARWEQYYNHYYFSVSQTHCDYIRYFDGDTLLNGQNYMILMSQESCQFLQQQVDSLGNTYYDTTFTDTLVLKAFLREANQRIYALFPGLTTEYMLYRFDFPDTTRIDSLVFQNQCSPFSPVYALSHDTVCIGPIGRKRWQISYNTYYSATSYIEGVGPNTGILTPICRNGCPECSHGLVRFIMNGDTLYQGECSIPPSPSGFDERLQKLEIRLNPQPATDRVMIESPFENANLVLYDLYGKRLVSVPAIGRTFNMDTSVYPPGMYFIRLSKGARYSSKPLLISR